MKREDLRRLFAQARKLSGETDYVVLGSLAALGQGSPFEAEHGYYLDPISPHVATLPTGWSERLVRIELEPGLAA
jgi:hypothetical protein